VHHNQEVEATRLLGLVKGGQTLQNAAWGSGLQVTHTPALSRDRPSGDVPAELVHTLFTLQPGGGTMVETNKGFVVAQLTDIVTADPKNDAADLSQTESGLAHALHDDYLTIYATALRQEAKPVERPEVVLSLIQQQGE
jgi:hypothetical protein